MNEKILVSIIIPVYNTAEYLPTCLDSLCGQTYNNIEIVAVDDGSSDNSLEILKQYAETDARIRIISQENKGSSFARKTGIQNVLGAYVLFVDSDDWIELDTVEKCITYAVENSSDCVMFSYIKEYPSVSIENFLFDSSFSYSESESEEKVHRRIIGPKESELTHPEKVDNLVSVCMKLYKTEAVKRGKIVSERVVGTSEDTIFNLYALENCKISYIHQCFYHYRKSNMHSITTQHKADLSEKWNKLYMYFEEYIENSGKKDQYYPVFLNRVACCIIGLGINEICGTSSIGAMTKKLKYILDKPLYKMALKQLDMTYFPFKWKVFFTLCKRRQGLLLVILLKIMNYLRARIAI